MTKLQAFIVAVVLVAGIGLYAVSQRESLGGGSPVNYQPIFTNGLRLGTAVNNSAIKGFNCGTASWNPGSLTSSTAPVTAATTTSVTVTGGTVSSTCSASLSSATSTSHGIRCAISSANTATVVLENYAGAALDIATGTVRACATQF